jgi:hypothetical protein
MKEGEKHMKNNIVVVSILVALVFGGGGFVAGMKYSQSKRGNFMTQQGDGNRTGARLMTQGGPSGATRNTFRPVSGTIASIDETSITVKLQDGSSKVILLSDKTSISKSQEGVKTDLLTGEAVTVFGAENADGSVTAQNVQLGTLGGPMGSASGAPRQ